MIIQINDTNKIVAFFEDGLIKADNETTFSVKNFKGFVKGVSLITTKNKIKFIIKFNK